jgi:hypothetical protein
MEKPLDSITGSSIAAGWSLDSFIGAVPGSSLRDRVQTAMAHGLMITSRARLGNLVRYLPGIFGPARGVAPGGEGLPNRVGLLPQSLPAGGAAGYHSMGLAARAAASCKTGYRRTYDSHYEQPANE